MENWQKVVTEILQKQGMTEKQLAERVGCTQPAINRIKRGQRTPRYNIGTKLMALYESRVA